MAINLPNPPPASSPSDFNSPGWQNWFARLASLVRGVSAGLLVSPAFSGTPTAPTAPTGTNTTQLATTAFVQTAISLIPTAGAISNVVSSATTIAVDTSYTVISYFTINSDLTLNGNLMVIG